MVWPMSSPKLFHADTAALPADCRVVIPRPRLQRLGDGWEYSWEVRVVLACGEEFSAGGAWFRSNVEIRPLSGLGNAALAGSLVPLMQLGLPVTIEAGVSPRLLRNLRLWQQAFAAWFPAMKPVEIECERCGGIEPPESGGARGQAALMSLGVDSWFTLQRHLPELTHLVFLDGFDITGEQVEARRQMRGQLRAVAGELRLPLVILESNLREFLDRWCDWLVPGGAYLGAATMLLEGLVDRVWEGSSARLHTPGAIGSNGLTDPLFATERLQMRYDGGEFQRIDKLVRLLDWPTAMRNLRVCWSGTDGLRNCGRCPKCLRTMAAIQLLGDPAQAPLFPPETDLSLLAKLPFGYGMFADCHRMLELAARLGTADQPVARVIREILDQGEIAAMMAEESGGLTRMQAADWRRIGKEQREDLVADLMQHAPGLVDDMLVDGVMKVPREVLAAMWAKDRQWLRRRIEAAAG